MSYAEQVFLAEEIGREVAKNITIQKNEVDEVIVKTEEKRPRHPHIVNHSIHEANKWYEIKLPRNNVQAWSLRLRENYNINYCFEPSVSTYMTLSAGGTLNEDTAPDGIHAIYVRTAEADVTIELELWRDAPSLELFP